MEEKEPTSAKVLINEKEENMIKFIRWRLLLVMSWGTAMDGFTLNTSEINSGEVGFQG